MTVIALAALLMGPTIDLKFVPTGMTAKMGGYVPVRAEMSPESGTLKVPANFPSAMFGKLPIGEKSFVFGLSEPAEGNAQLIVDTNNDGDLTNDTPAEWAPRKQGASTMYFGTGKVRMNGVDAGLGVYRFDKNDPQRAALKNTLLYYTDFGYEGKGKFGKETFTVALAGAVTPDARLWIDRNGNGKSDGRSESITANKPFNFGGTTYELKVTGNSYSVETSAQTVAEVPLPPDLGIGKDVPKFTAVDMEGNKVEFPKSYKGKIVMLDFWATWCGPCIAELPNVIKAYEKYHDRGFEVLGISFDQENMADKVRAFTKEKNMPWAQVYEGKFWNTTIGTQFAVEGIPFCLLVDGSTGKILANVNKLRGEALEATLSEVFSKK